MSSLTRSTRPTLPFLPFGLFSSAIIPLRYGSRRDAGATLHSRQKCSRIVEFARQPLRPLIQARGVDNDLPVWRQLYVRAVHRTRRRSLKINAFAVVTTAVARTFKFVLARLPVGRATQVRAARVNYEYAVRRAIDPDAVFLLK